MARCEVCGNDYDKSFEVVAAGARHTFDSFECAIHGESTLVLLTMRYFASDPGCVKTHKSAEGRKYNSPTRYLAESAQYD